MKKTKIRSAIEQCSLRFPTKTLMVGGVTLAMLGMTNTIHAQSTNSAEPIEEIVVTGIRQSLANALAEKRESDNLIEVIRAEDIGKLPDQNLAEVLENITGIQITRTAGVGSNVQIRGDDANRVEFNGVSTVGSGSSREGIDFEDVNASIISSVEVTKSPEAKTIEGSVGGTINLKTIRPLDLKETLGSIRIQGEDSDFSQESIQPRISGAFGDNWDTSIGRIGWVISGSYTEQEAVSFRPRADADTLFNVANVDPAALAAQGLDPANLDVSGDFLGVQFLLQEQENDDFETINLATTFEWQPNDNLKFHLDYVLNDQERSRDQYRLQGSGVSAALNTNVPTSVESVDFRNGLVVDSPDDLDELGNLVTDIAPSDLSSAPLGIFQRAATGNIIPFLADDDDDPNLRFTTETNSRVTESEILVLGGDWESGKWKVGAEIALTDSETVNPTLNTTLNFINPACPPDGSSNDNCVPFVFDLTGGQLAFDVLTVDRALEQGLDPVAVFAPTEADLTNPANVVLDAVSQDLDTTDNSEDAFRLDLSYAFADEGFTSVDFGYRYSKTESTFRNVGDSFGFSALEDSPNGLLFE